MMEFKPTDAYRSPLPRVFKLECHPKGAVAQDVDGIRNIGTIALLERPSYSSATAESVLHAGPESIVFKGHILDEDLHTCNESFAMAGLVSSHKA
jgi:hypothetical protein